MTNNPVHTIERLVVLPYVLGVLGCRVCGGVVVAAAVVVGLVVAVVVRRDTHAYLTRNRRNAEYAVLACCQGNQSP